MPVYCGSTPSVATCTDAGMIVRSEPRCSYYCYDYLRRLPCCPCSRSDPVLFDRIALTSILELRINRSATDRFPRIRGGGPGAAKIRVESPSR